MSNLHAMPGGAQHGQLHAARLMTSQYLKTLTHPDNHRTFLYHSLFGNIHLVDVPTIDLIRKFAEPINPSDVRSASHDPDFCGRMIDEFLSLYYLVPEGFDERELTQSQLTRRAERLSTGELITAIQLNVSEGCNLKCTYCFADRVDERSTLYNIGVRNDKRLMTLETAIESVDVVTRLLRKRGNYELVIKFFGREPMLNWKAIDGVIDYCASIDDFDYRFAITTNGTLFTPDVINKFKRANFTIVVSLDGFAEANLLRVTHSGDETFSAVDRGLRLLKDHGVMYCVASVLTEQNFDLLDERFLDYLASRSVVQWEVKLAMQTDDAVRRPAAAYAQKLCDFYRYGKKLGISVTGDWYDPFVTLFHTTKRTADECVDRLAPNSCSATDHQISIEPSGAIFGCRSLDTQLGSIENLDDLFQSPTYQQLSMRTYYNVPFCHGCKLEGFCQGVCLGHSERKYNDIYRPDSDYCEVYRKVFDLLLLDYFEN